MDYLDRIIPLAVLGIVGLLLLYVLIRRKETEAVEAVAYDSNRAVVTESMAPQVEVALPMVEALVPPPEPPMVEPELELAKVKPKPTMAIVEHENPKTPVHTVLGMLKEEDTLSAAFVLGEVLGTPVSRRN